MARQDRLRRETLEYEAQLRQKTELERVKAETSGRILAERRNHDLRIEQVTLAPRPPSRGREGRPGDGSIPSPGPPSSLASS